MAKSKKRGLLIKHKILKKTYKVYEYEDIDEGKCYGETNFNTLEIKLCRKNHENRKNYNKTYFHEFWHAMWDELSGENSQEKKADAFAEVMSNNIDKMHKFVHRKDKIKRPK